MYLALERGLSFKLTMGNIITLCPPLTVTEVRKTPSWPRSWANFSLF
jgi:hypothetical protein